MKLSVDLTALPMQTRQRIKEVLTDENARELVMARIRQEKVKRLYDDFTPKPKEGIGPVSMVVDPYWRNYFEMAHGRPMFDDADFVEWLKKKEPMFAVHERGTKIQVLNAGIPAGSKRRVKSYG